MLAVRFNHWINLAKIIVAFFDPSQFEILVKLMVAAIVGGLLGAERSLIGKPAGVRTFALTALGAALFTALAPGGFQFFNLQPGLQYEPYRVLAQLVVAVGFLATGVIILRRGQVEGLTTAAGLWVTAAIGAAIGLGLYLAALGAALIVFVVLFLIWHLEAWLEKHFGIDLLPDDFEKQAPEKDLSSSFLRRFFHKK